MIIENYDIDAVKRRYIDDPLIYVWYMYVYILSQSALNVNCAY